jgi:hypothetical protein
MLPVGVERDRDGEPFRQSELHSGAERRPFAAVREVPHDSRARAFSDGGGVIV